MQKTKLPSGYILIIAYILFALFLSAIGLINNSNNRKNLIEAKQGEIRAIALSLASAYNQWMDERVADGALFSRNPVYGDLFYRFRTGRATDEEKARLVNWMRLLEQNVNYDLVALLDSSGTEFFREPPGHPGQAVPEGKLKSVKKTIVRLGTNRIGKDSIKHAPEFTLLIPIFAHPGDTLTANYLAAHIDGNQTLFPLLNRYQKTLKTGLTHLIYQDKKLAILLECDAESPELISSVLDLDKQPELREALESPDAPLVVELLGERRVVCYVPVEGTHWHAGVSVDINNALEEMPARRLNTILPLLMIFFVTGLVLMFFWRLQKEWLMEQRIESMQALQESQARYRELFQNSPVPMWVYRMSDLRFLEANDSAVANYGYSRDEFLTMTIKDIRPREDLERLLVHMKVIRAEIQNSGTWRHITKDGRIRDVEISSHLIEYKGEPASMVMAYDVTDKMQMTADLIKSRERAEESEQLKSSFLANMSHEIRTPMNAIVGFSSLLEETDNPKEKSKYISMIQGGADQLLHIIDDILDVSRIESGQVSITPQVVDLHELLSQLENQYKVIMARKGSSLVKLLLELPDGDTPSRANVDPQRLIRIVSILIDNAIKFTSEGSITFGYGPDLGKSRLRFFVRDTGIGIRPDQQAVIFERFRQAEASLNRRFGGTGLGLAISKSLIELMGGEIGVTSREGEGAEFWFTIPQ